MVASMRLKEIRERLGAEAVGGTSEQWSRSLKDLECHPQRLRPDALFAIFPEYFVYNVWSDETDGRAAVQQTPPQAILAREPVPGFCGPQLIHPLPREAFAHLAREFFGRPDAALPVIGVTGTNGKTTTTRLIAHLLEKLEVPAGCLGTLGTTFRGKPWTPGEFTTDLALANFRTLAALRDAGAGAVAMEVSSHGLALDRVAAIDFRVAVLTNVTRDHLDFHGTQAAYVAAKRRLFEELSEDATAVLNADDPHAAEFLASTAARVTTFGMAPTADWRCEALTTSADGAVASVRVGEQVFSLCTRLVGRFQVANILAAAAALGALGHAPGEIFSAIQDFEPAPGRMEAMTLQRGATAIIDFAHNPDALANLLSNCREMKPRRILLVFGCGGDRDRGKRPLMGAIAAEGADAVWVTADNPRTEALNQIFADIRRGLPGNFAGSFVEDRAQAIEMAWRECGEGDLLVIAGKGHEDYQIVGTKKFPYSDRSVLEALEGGVRVNS
jgi:UDP-N-acetylmuramoyl-L-alanyl-D-glutamate--2,6-diaminopimelate ligase